MTAVAARDATRTSTRFDTLAGVTPVDVTEPVGEPPSVFEASLATGVVASWPVMRNIRPPETASGVVTAKVLCPTSPASAILKYANALKSGLPELCADSERVQPEGVVTFVVETHMMCITNKSPRATLEG